MAAPRPRRRPLGWPPGRAALAALALLWLAPAGAAEPPPQERELHVGALLALPVPHSKSDWVEVEAEGDAVRAVHDPLAGTVALQGVRPGRARVRIASTFARFRDPDARPRLVADLRITVSPAHAGGPGAPRSVDPADVPAPRAAAPLDWEGSVSLQAEELSAVITDAAAWTALWRSAFGAPAPAVDFSSHAVACVFLGHQADWLYRIAFDEPTRAPGHLVVPYELVQLVLELAGPLRTSGQYRLKAFPREAGRPAVLHEVGRSAPAAVEPPAPPAPLAPLAPPKP